MEKPREKLLKYGIKSLKDEEVLAILLNTGTKNNDVLSLSKKLLEEISIVCFQDITLNELMNIKGIKLAKAARILCAMEFVKRINNYVSKIKLDNPENVYKLLMGYQHKAHEHFILLCIDTKCNLLSQKVIFIGTTNSVNIYPKDILSEAVKRNAQAVIIAHNHPSGDYYPSKEDFAVTELLKNCLQMVQIALYDHLIISRKGYYSFAEHGHIK